MTDLAEFTKGELIQWINQNCHFNRPKKHDLLHIRWVNESNLLMVKERELSEYLNSITFKGHDELAKRFNESTDLKEKDKIAKKLQTYYDKFKVYYARLEKLNLERLRIEKIYQSIDKARNEMSVAS